MKINSIGRRISAPLSSFMLLSIPILTWGGVALGANLPGSFSGNAYASYANVTAGPLASGLGNSAYIPCPCQGTNGKVQSNSIASLSVGAAGSVLTLGAATSTVLTNKTTATAEVTDTSTIAGVSLFGGLITADALTAIADVTATASTIKPSAAGSTFVNLKIGGQAIDADVAANSVVSLPGIGSVTLKKVVSSSNATSGTMKVEMISVAVSTANSYGLPVGVTVVVGHALSGFTRVQPVAVMGGQAYGALANAAIGGALKAKIGQPALVTIPCLGTNGQILTNTVNSTTVAGILSLGASTTTAFGGSQDASRIARTTTTIAGVNLLGGLIGATTITSVAQETALGNVRTRSTAGTSFAGLKVGLLNLPVDVAPNTTIALPGLGRVVINEQTVPATGGKTIVNGLHVFVSTKNLLGLPVGTEIMVAHADAFAFTFPN